MDLLLYEIQSIAGKGKGLVALVDIAKGKRVLCEKPLFTTPNLSPISFMESQIATKLQTLSKPAQHQFLSLHNNFPGKYPFSGIVKTNALPCGPGSRIGGVYPTINLINHSCLPNANHSWNSDLNCETIHKIRDIPAGEKITISYESGDTFEIRRTHLKNSFGFECTCTLCSLPLPSRQTSDSRRLEIKSLDDTIGNPIRVVNDPDDALADCHRLLQLLEEEYKDCTIVLIARLYYDAFQITISHGDQARASIFAERVYKTRVICEGEDSPQTKKLKNLMMSPSEHMSFGHSKRRGTVKGMVPKGLDGDAFEKWLWRQGK